MHLRHTNPPSRLSHVLALAVAASLAIAPCWAAPGDLDPSFGGSNKGVVLDTLGGAADAAYAVAIQHDGKIVAAGTTYPKVGVNSYILSMIRHNPDGTFDTTFGGTGAVATAVGNSYQGDYANEPRSTAILPDGEILVEGTDIGSGDFGGFMLADYNPDGTLNSAFGSGGALTTVVGLADYGDAMAVGRDQKIVSGGEYVTTSDGAYRIALFRHTTFGVADTSFGGRGQVLFPNVIANDSKDYLEGIAVQPNGRIVIYGISYPASGMPVAFVLRLLANGSLDASFGNGGVAVLDLTAAGYSPAPHGGIAVQPDGKILVAGAGGSGVLAFRFNGNGTLDKTFNGQGWLVHAVNAQISSMTLLPTGKFMAAGTGPLNTFFVSRYTADGHVDTTFTDSTGATQGYVDTPLLPGNGGAFAKGLTVAPNGKFVLAGYSQAYEAIAQYLGDPMHVVPASATFTNVTGVPVNTPEVSNVITVSGLSAGVSVPIYVTNGTYSINGDAWTSSFGYVKNGDQVMVTHTSAATSQTSVTTTLKYGGMHAPNNLATIIGAQNTATFTSTTQ